ncbi:tyrosine-type recombinase/integrase [Paenibacillus sp. MMO-58]|uniref:tyrosine-type recombinase/integrase n=1 Tax=Paenibacillus sp. MMO-58 TaxID=3081290 RepID=UPI0030184560
MNNTIITNWMTNNSYSLDNLSKNKERLEVLLNNEHYDLIHSYIIRTENDAGDYDYSSLSNIGMLYLYLHKVGTNRVDNTKKEYAREIMQFFNKIHSNGVSDIRLLKRSQVEGYRSWLIQEYTKTTTQAKKITIVSSFLSWCYEEKYLRRDLRRALVNVKVEREQIPEREIDHSSFQAAIKYYEHDPKFKGLILLISSTGLRLNEVITPDWKDLYFDSVRSKYYLRTITKRGHERHAHIKEYVLKEIIEYRRRLGLNVSIDPTDESPFYPNRTGKRYLLTSLSAIVTKKLAKAQVVTIQNNKVTAHYFRHFFARTAFNSGAPTDRISKTLGHSSSKITEENYLHRELKKEHDVSDFVDLNEILQSKP